MHIHNYAETVSGKSSLVLVIIGISTRLTSLVYLLSILIIIIVVIAAVVRHEEIDDLHFEVNGNEAYAPSTQETMYYNTRF